jgi:hypothetical protein
VSDDISGRVSYTRQLELFETRLAALELAGAGTTRDLLALRLDLIEVKHRGELLDEKLFGGSRSSEGGGIIGELRADIKALPKSIAVEINTALDSRKLTAIMAKKRGIWDAAVAFCAGGIVIVVHWLATGKPF